MAVQRTLFIPWLIEQIDSGRFPGVNWTNEEKTKFCIPWKHGLRQDSSSYDVLIFKHPVLSPLVLSSRFAKAWAVKSGLYVEGEMPADPSMWKRNFRSALRAKGFKLVVDNRNDAANPHKVFLLPNGEGQQGAERARRRSRREVREDHPSVDFVQQNPTFQVQPFLPSVLSTPQHYSAVDVSPHLAPEPGIDQDPLNALLGLTIGDVNQETPVPVVLEMYHADGAAGMDAEMHQLAELKEKMNETMVDNVLSTNFRVSVYYRGVKVREQLVESSAGFRVVFRSEQVQPFTPPAQYDPTLTLVRLPGLDQVNIVDQMQAQLTGRILDKLGDGLEVRVEGSVIYGLRRGDTHIYWSLCKHERSDTPREVGKYGDQLYKLKDFVAGLVEFIKQGKGEAPSFSLFFCLGEKWPDQRPWEKKLIMVEVVLSSLEALKMIAVDGGASSLRSVELQLSDPPSLVDTLMEWMDTY
ncbi:interferon regulatory factor 3-like [Scleropages formosus]|uniref:Interferon regulatory factor 3-like n=1 Tax=Scleropages formosus TaxID=113540 RepID=A0A0P7UFL8_SCLFO|nr:interferon regulatory factor 3-like [Scleropages formosus]